MGLIQSVIERSGIATVGVSLLAEVTRKVRPPRTLFRDRPLGFPLGPAFAASFQRGVVLSALEMAQVPVDEPWLLERGEEIREQAG